MFKSSSIEKIRIIVGKSYYEEALSALRDLGVLQIEVLGEQDRAMLEAVENQGYKRISDYAQRFRGLESILYPRTTERKVGFRNIDQLIAAADSVTIDTRASDIKTEMDRIAVTAKELTDKSVLLHKLTGFNRDLKILNSSMIVSFMVSGKELEKFEAAISKGVGDAIISKLGQLTIISIRKSAEKDFGIVAEKFKVEMDLIPQMDGTVIYNLSYVDQKLRHLSERREALESELNHMSDNHYSEVSAIREQFDIEMETLDATAKLGATESAVVVEGWIISRSVEKLKKVLESATKNHFILERIRTDEMPPTRLENPVTIRIYEFFIRFYSLPKSDEIDPTIMFAIIFPIFFGFMIGDVGYALVILLGSIWLIRRLTHPPAVSKLPKALTKFVKTIISPSGMLTIAKTIIPGAIIGVLFGIFFNEWFGFQLPYQTPFPVDQGLPTLLKAAGDIGVFMVLFGFILGFLNKMAIGEKKHAIAKLGWLAAAIGIVIFGLNVLYKADMGASNLEAVASYVLLIGGVITILKTEGLQALMELPSLISHILSYTRLVGILLASVILAEVIDIVFLAGFRHGIILTVLGIIIFIVGQLFNLIIAIFEPGIQGARLIYVEFFSKFFTGNGTEFKPFKTNRKNTLSRFSLEKEKGK